MGQFTTPTDGQSARLFITATIQPGWHIYSITQPSGGPVATKIEVKPPQGVRVTGDVPGVQPSRLEEGAGLRQPDGRNPPRHGHLVRADRVGGGHRPHRNSRSRERSWCGRATPIRVCRRRRFRLRPRWGRVSCCRAKLQTAMLDRPAVIHTHRSICGRWRYNWPALLGWTDPQRHAVRLAGH